MAARVVRGVARLEAPLAASVITLGSFDGVHLGHQALLARTIEAARRLDVPAVVYTFDPHPTKVFAPARAPRTLMDIEERLRHFRAHGIDLVVVEPFDDAFASLDAERWVDEQLVGRLRPRHIVVGYNFTYGRGGRGDVASLAEAGRKGGFDLEVVDPISIAGELVSSSRVRDLLLAGDVVGARMFLGHPFAITGKVAKGDQRGRRIGFPTANIEPAHELVPKRGVYASMTEILSEGMPSARYSSITNIGMRPTFSGEVERIETHLFGFAGGLYGERLRVELIHRIRDERRFDGIDALVEQIRLDVCEARRLLASKGAKSEGAP